MRTANKESISREGEKKERRSQDVQANDCLSSYRCSGKPFSIKPSETKGKYKQKKQLMF